MTIIRCLLSYFFVSSICKKCNSDSEFRHVSYESGCGISKIVFYVVFRNVYPRLLFEFPRLHHANSKTTQLISGKRSSLFCCHFDPKLYDCASSSNFCERYRRKQLELSTVILLLCPLRGSNVRFERLLETLTSPIRQDEVSTSGKRQVHSNQLVS